MSKTIHFKGAKYDSVEEMPPDVRAEYEAGHSASYADILQTFSEAEAISEGQTLTPAWGGPRADGGVPVPVEFDGVKDLGPAVSVTEHDGFQFIPDFGATHATMLVRYQDGLAFRTTGKDVHELRWEEVAAILSNHTSHVGNHGGVWTEREYTLIKKNGEKVILDDRLKQVGGEGEATKKAVYALIGPPLVQGYQAGETLTFGPVTVQRQNGLQLSGQAYAWDAIQDVRVEAGRFKVTLRDGKKHEARVNAIPNLEILCQIIGVNMNSAHLPYY